MTKKTYRALKIQKRETIKIREIERRKVQADAWDQIYDDYISRENQKKEQLEKQETEQKQRYDKTIDSLKDRLNRFKDGQFDISKIGNLEKDIADYIENSKFSGSIGKLKRFITDFYELNDDESRNLELFLADSDLTKIFFTQLTITGIDRKIFLTLDMVYYNNGIDLEYLALLIGMSLEYEKEKKRRAEKYDEERRKWRQDTISGKILHQKKSENKSAENKAVIWLSLVYPHIYNKLDILINNGFIEKTENGLNWKYELSLLAGLISSNIGGFRDKSITDYLTINHKKIDHHVLDSTIGKKTVPRHWPNLKAVIPDIELVY